MVIRKGAFIESLNRNNKKIREDRAVSIYEEAQLEYKRIIEDMEIKIKKLVRERENMLDLSSGNTVASNNFVAEKYIDKDISIGIKIRKLEIQLGIAKERYEYLFGGV